MLLVIIALGVEVYARTFEEFVHATGSLQGYTERSAALESELKGCRFSLNLDHDSIQECNDRIAKSRNKICAKYLQINNP